jgi:glycosyltransferase involved in cell wall biosynthesis
MLTRSLRPAPRRLIADGYDVHTMIAGKANDEMGLGQLKQVQSTLPNVSYIGWISAEQLAVAYASSDMLLFPSAVETFGNVTLEGMASGIPVIVDKTTGGHLIEDGASRSSRRPRPLSRAWRAYVLAWLLTRAATLAVSRVTGLNGYTVQSGDVDGFYAAAKRLCAPDAGPLRAQLGAAGRKRATEHYDNEANTAEMLRHYREIIGRPTSSIKKLSLHWVWIDLFSNVVLGIFMIGVWILKRMLLLSVQLYGFSSNLKHGPTK